MSKLIWSLRVGVCDAGKKHQLKMAIGQCHVHCKYKVQKDQDGYYSPKFPILSTLEPKYTNLNKVQNKSKNM